jgi:hypothetical protein
MKPGNRQFKLLKWCQFTQSGIALTDERKVIVSAFLLMQKGFFVHEEGSHSNRNGTGD